MLYVTYVLHYKFYYYISYCFIIYRVYVIEHNYLYNFIDY